MNAQTAARTAGPWTAEDYAVSTGETGWSVKSGDDTVADVYTGETDAEFIVQACNAWDDAAALRARIAELEAGSARAALAKAGAL